MPSCPPKMNELVAITRSWSPKSAVKTIGGSSVANWSALRKIVTPLSLSSKSSSTPIVSVADVPPLSVNAPAGQYIGAASATDTQPPIATTDAPIAATIMRRPNAAAGFMAEPPISVYVHGRTYVRSRTQCKRPRLGTQGPSAGRLRDTVGRRGIGASARSHAGDPPRREWSPTGQLTARLGDSASAVRSQSSQLRCRPAPRSHRLTAAVAPHRPALAIHYHYGLSRIATLAGHGDRSGR